mgnify:CR=1 FL=1
MKKFFRITTWLLGFSTLVAGLAASSMGAYSVRAQTAAPEALTRESADLLYHLCVLWADGGIRPEDVWAELARREGMSGLAEKASRKTDGSEE